jgi:putative selenium metabolism hydrolase
METIAYPIDDTRTLSLARELARTPSPSGSEAAAIELAAAAMSEAGMTVTVDRAGNAIGTIGPGRRGATRLLIDGHIDTIPLHSAERWSVDPFGGEIRDGRIYGLGICDQKASIAAAISALHTVRGQIEETSGLVAVVASVAEEHMEGLALAVAMEQIQPTLAITTEPSDTRLVVGQRGRAKVEARVTGRSCHAGHAAQGINAVEAMAALIDRVRRQIKPTHRRLGSRDLTCIDVASSPYPSISTVPSSAVARFDCRFLPADSEVGVHDLIRAAADEAWADWPEPPILDVDTVLAGFTTHTGLALGGPEYAKAWWTDGDIVADAEEALEAVGLDPTPSHYSFCTNGSYTAGVLGLPTIGFGVGEQHMAHQVDESVTLESLRAGSQGLASLAVGLSANR